MLGQAEVDVTKQRVLRLTQRDLNEKRVKRLMAMFMDVIPENTTQGCTVIG
jgi:hypothetical protein